MRIIFCGTPEFAVPTLQKLIDSPHEIIAVYTQPDRPAGRGQKLTISPVKKLAAQHSIPISQPASLRDAHEYENLQRLDPDLIIVVAYGMILPGNILDLPRFGCINVHPSLLPRWRGAAPIQRAIFSGDEITGVTIMQMDAGLDSGPMLLREPFPISSTDTSGSLHEKLSHVGASALLTVVQQAELGTLHPEAQDISQVSYAKKIEKHEAEIDWQIYAVEIDRLIRAFNPKPGAFTYLKGQLFKIWQAQPIQQAVTQQPGTIVEVTKNGIDVATGYGVLRLQQVQLSGGKSLMINELLNSKAELFSVGMKLGR